MSSIYISDVMENVAATVEVQGWSEQFGGPDMVWQKTFVYAGIGEPDPERWLHRALIALTADTGQPAQEGS